MSEQKNQHLLALKVMRLTGPTLSSNNVIANYRYANAGDRDPFVIENCSGNENADAKSVFSVEKGTAAETCNMLILPQSLGNIYLGETFSSYVSLHNDSSEICHGVSLKCEMQTLTQKIVLLPLKGAEETASSTIFHPGSCLDFVVHHEVKELDTHLLVCEVDYSTSQKEKKKIRKFFKFQSAKPLDVKTKFYMTKSDEIFLEAQIQNVTSGPLCLESVCLDSSQHFFEVTDLNISIANDGQVASSGVSIFGQINSLLPFDCRQYLFSIKPKESEVPSFEPKFTFTRASNIGKLDITWQTSVGGRGRLQTSQLQRTAVGHTDIRVKLKDLPSAACLKKSLCFTAKIQNNSDRTMDIDLSLMEPDHLSNHKFVSFLWNGNLYRKFGLVKPGGTFETSLEIVPNMTGFLVISGLRVLDNLLSRTYDIDELGQVFVSAETDIVEILIYLLDT